jgi:hypothetical protein
MRNSDAYKINCQMNGQLFNQEFYEKLLKADLKREKDSNMEKELYNKIYSNINVEENIRNKKVYRARPDSMDETIATILYIFVMLFGSIFNGRILIWIIATIVFINFKTSHWIEKGE